MIIKSLLFIIVCLFLYETYKNTLQMTEEYFTFEKQIELINNIVNKEEHENVLKLCLEYKFNNIFTIGNHFNTTNNRFIAPVEGKYLFQVNHNVYGLSDDQYFRTRIYLNGSPYAILGYAKARGGGDHTTNDSMLLSLSPSDYVEVFTSSNDTSYQMSAGDGWNHFSGFLVG